MAPASSSIGQQRAKNPRALLAPHARTIIYDDFGGDWPGDKWYRHLPIPGLCDPAAVVTCAGGADAPLVLEATIPLPDTGGRIDHMAVDLRRGRLFVAELGNGTVDVVDLASRKVMRRLGGFREPQGIGYEPSTDALYIANAGDGSVHVLRADDLSLLGRIDLGDDADNVRIDPQRGRVLVGYGKGALAVIDPQSRAKLADIPLKAHPEGFRIEPDGARAFVNVPDAGLIQVADLAKGQAVGMLPTRGHHANFPMALDDGAHRMHDAAGGEVDERLLHRRDQVFEPQDRGNFRFVDITKRLAHLDCVSNPLCRRKSRATVAASFFWPSTA